MNLSTVSIMFCILYFTFIFRISSFIFRIVTFYSFHVILCLFYLKILEEVRVGEERKEEKSRTSTKKK